MAQDEEKSIDSEGRQPVWEHLDELRTRLIKVVVAVMLTTALAYNYAEPMVRWLEAPLLRALPPDQAFLYFTGIADKFFAYLKVSMVAGIALASPYLLWQLWGFVAPALEQKEKKFVVPFVFFGTLSFGCGIAFGYYIVLPTGYDFLIHFGSPHEKPLITITEYFSLTLKLLLALGLVFEVPVVMGLLARFGVIRADTLRHVRKQAIVINAIVAAILTPTPDAFTMILVLVPLHLLFELGIVVVSWIEKTDERDDNDEAGGRRDPLPV